jgi:hypothetical protein
VETGDSVTYTFSVVLLPYLGYLSWDGSPRAVIAGFDHHGSVSTLQIEDTDGSTLPLGIVDLGAHYTGKIDFTGSTMTATGDTITVVLGTAGGGTLNTISTPTTMTWTSYGGSADESGVPDVDF